MHGLRVAVIQAAIGHCDLYSGTIVTETLRQQSSGAAIARDNFGGHLVEHLHPSPWLDPKHAFRVGERFEARGIYFSAEDRAGTKNRFLMKFRESVACLRSF